MKLSVLQWNVWFKERADNILAEIQRLDPDIVCLQELTTHSAINPNRNIPAEIALLGYSQAYVHTLHNSETDMGNGIFTKMPITNSEHVLVQHEDPRALDRSVENRAYVEAQIRTPVGELVVGTVHLSYANEYLDAEAKKEEADRLLAAAGQNAARFILAGDFNALPDSYTVKTLDKRFVSAGPLYHQATWPTKLLPQHSFDANLPSQRIDYVYTTPDIRVLDSSAVPTHASDHLPIFTTVEI